MFCDVVRSVLFTFVTILLRKRGLITLRLSLYCRRVGFCVLCLFGFVMWDGLSPFKGGGSAIADLLFGVLSLGCGGFFVCLCFVVHYSVSVLLLQSS